MTNPAQINRLWTGNASCFIQNKKIIKYDNSETIRLLNDLYVQDKQGEYICLAYFCSITFL